MIKQCLLVVSIYLLVKIINSQTEDDVVVAVPFEIKDDYNNDNMAQIKGTEQRRTVRHIITHNFDQPTFSNDIALLHLNEPFHLSSAARTAAICLPGTYQTFDGLAVVTGWGRLSETGDSPQYLQHVTIPLIDKSACKMRYHRIGFSRYLNTCQICAGVKQGGKDACQGDSGGPLICTDDKNTERYYLCGLVSWGIGCARPNYPGVYTEVSCFIDWIRNSIERTPS